MNQTQERRGADVPLPLAALGDWCLVNPLYDSDKLGSIYIPNSAKNPQSQQGIVAASGRRSEFRPKDHILYEPYNAEPFWYNDHEYLAVPDRIIVGSVKDNVVQPRPDSVIIRPDFGPSGPRTTAGSTIITLSRVFENPQVQTGQVVRIGSTVHDLHLPIQPGTTVVIPPLRGHEIGLDSPDLKGVFYFLRAKDILAVIL